MAEFGIVKAASRTSTGTQDFTVSGFGTPKAALFLVSIALADGTVANHAILGVGATDGTRDWCLYGRSKHGIALGVTKTGGLAYNVRCVVLEDADGSTLIEAQFSSWITDGVRINFTTAPASAYLITCILIGGTGIANAYVDTLTTPATINTGTVTTAPGFQADLVIVASDGGVTMNGTGSAGNRLTFGFVQRGASNPHTQMSQNTMDFNGVATSALLAELVTNRCAQDENATRGAVEIQDFTSTGFTAMTRDIAGTYAFGYLALKLSGLVAKVMAVNAPAATGAYTISGVGFTPQFALLGLSSHDTNDQVDNSSNFVDVFGIGAITAATQAGYGMASTDGINTTTQAQTITSTNPVNLQKAGVSFQVESFTAFTSDGMTLNATTADGTVRKRIGLFVQATGAGPGSGADSLPVVTSDLVRPVSVSLSIQESG